MTEFWCWRHPKARGAAGRCIGSTDLDVDPRKAKRLAHRIRNTARRHGLAREVWVSPLQRALRTGQWLRCWGWVLHVDARLAELDFGHWDDKLWADIPWHEVQRWEQDLLQHAPGGGESLATLSLRVRSFVAEQQQRSCLLVSHGGWINTLLHVPSGTQHLPASAWPAPPRHATLIRWPGA